VIIKGTEYYDGKQSRYVDMPVTDVLQMMGRAGRPQFDDSGAACIFVHEPKKTFYKRFLHDPFPVESSLHLQLHDHLNAEIASGSLCTVRDCIEYLSWTYYFRRLLVNPTYYGLTLGEDEEETSGMNQSRRQHELTASMIEKHLTKLLSQVLSDLLRAGCITMEAIDDDDDDDDGAAAVQSGSYPLERAGEDMAHGTFHASYLGRIASVYYLQHRSVAMFHEQLLDLHELEILSHSKDSKDSSTMYNDHRRRLWSLLFLCSHAFEYSELPVRHNEEHLNLELAELIDESLRRKDGKTMSLLKFLEVRKSDYQSPHIKTFLLLLAHIHSIKLPISDYINDTKSVLDQFNRVLNAMIDISGEDGLLAIVSLLAQVSQYVTQKLPDDASDLLQLPAVMSMSSGNREELMRRLDRHLIHSLRDMANLCIDIQQGKRTSREVEEVMRSMSTSSDPSSTRDVVSVVAKGNSQRGRGLKQRSSNNSNNNSNSTANSGGKESNDFSGLLSSLPLLDLDLISIANRTDLHAPRQVLLVTRRAVGSTMGAGGKVGISVSDGSCMEQVSTVRLQCDVSYELTCSPRYLFGSYSGYNSFQQALTASSWWVVLGVPTSSNGESSSSSSNGESSSASSNTTPAPTRSTKGSSLLMNSKQIVSHYASGELLAMRRIGAVRDSSEHTVSLSFQVPPYEAPITELLLFFTCDNLAGIDMGLTIPVQLA